MTDSSYSLKNLFMYLIGKEIKNSCFLVQPSIVYIGPQLQPEGGAENSVRLFMWLAGTQAVHPSSVSPGMFNCKNLESEMEPVSIPGVEPGCSDMG